MKGLSNHIRYHNITSKEYYDLYLKNKDEECCVICGKPTRYVNIVVGYKKYCSTKCSNKSEEVKYKKKKTIIEKYGVENPFQADEIKEKIKQTNLIKYNDEFAVRNKEIKEKTKRTNLERYGTKSPLQNINIIEKRNKTNLEKYGSKIPIKNKDVIEKRNKTNLEKYGYTTPLKNKDVKIKTLLTNLEKYNVKNVLQNKEIRKKAQNSKKKYFLNNIFYNILNSFNLELLSDYNNSKENIKLKCLNCNHIFFATYDVISQGYKRCPKCYPRNKSDDEKKICYFIKSLNIEIVENSREIIPPYELDIYIPEKKITIEFDGLYYHSEKFNKDRNYHLNKTELCEKSNIRLIHIFEDEWVFKQEIVKSRLKQILELNNSERIHSRKCEIKEINSKIKNEFLNKYHIQGEDKSNIKLGAFYNDDLVSVMTFSHGNISHKILNDDVWELSRFCSNLNYHIPGIASKLLTYFKRNYEWKEIFSYADRRWSQGNLYYKIGFELYSITKPNYWYVKGIQRIHRFNLRKKYNEDKNISEKLMREREGYVRIWDCGHMKFILKNYKEI